MISTTTSTSTSKAHAQYEHLQTLYLHRPWGFAKISLERRQAGTSPEIGVGFVVMACFESAFAAAAVRCACGCPLPRGISRASSSRVVVFYFLVCVMRNLVCNARHFRSLLWPLTHHTRTEARKRHGVFHESARPASHVQHWHTSHSPSHTIQEHVRAWVRDYIFCFKHSCTQQPTTCSTLTCAMCMMPVTISKQVVFHCFCCCGASESKDHSPRTIVFPSPVLGEIDCARNETCHPFCSFTCVFQDGGAWLLSVVCFFVRN